VIALLAWLTSPLWGTLSYVEAGYLLLTLGIGIYLRGHLCDARAQLRVAQDPVERRAAAVDVRDVLKEILIQACFGLIGLYAALSPTAPIDPARVLGTLAVTGLLVIVQVANLVFTADRREARRWITEELRRERRPEPPPGVAPMVGGRRCYDTPVDPPSHERRPEVRG
jgi:hypothetical protein